MRKKLLLLALSLFATMAFSYAQEAIVGGGMDNSSDWTFYSDQGSSITDPTIATFGYTGDGPTGGSGGCLELKATGSGGNAATAAGYVYQKVTVVPGHKYIFNCLVKNIETDPINVGWISLILGDKKPGDGFDADSADFNYVKHPWLPAPKNSFVNMDTNMFATSQFLLKKGAIDSTGAYVDSTLTSDTITIQKNSPTSLYVTIRVGSSGNNFDFLFDNVTLYDITNGGPSSIAQTNAENNTIRVFPNPSTGIIYITSNNNTNSIKYGIYSISGTLVKSGNLGNKQSLDLSSFNKGVYVIKLQNGSSVECHKIILK